MLGILNFVAFIIVFMVVVIVHELGHFIFAKLFSVKVLEFAIGFGSAIWKKKIKGTLLRINIVPFGGYVRLKGEDITEEGEDSLYSKPAWQRLLIAFAGPLFSILTAYVLFIPIVINWGVPAVTIDKIVEDSPAERAGLKRGDVILEINGKKVFDTVEVSNVISKGETVVFTILRNDEKLKLTITPQLTPPEYFIVVDDVRGKVEKEIVKVNNFDIDKYNFEIGEYITMKDISGNKLSGVVKAFQYTPERYTVGFYYAGLSPEIAKDVEPFQKGDILVKVDNILVKDYLSLINLVSALNLKDNQFEIHMWGKKIKNVVKPLSDTLEITILRNGREINLSMKKEVFAQKISTPGFFKTENYVLKPKNIVESVILAVQRCNSAALYIWKTLPGIFFGKNTKEVAGPIGIAVLVGEAAKAGWEVILTVVALITLNLGIFNLFPLPALDGGRIIFSLIEIITRKKVNRKLEALIHTIGFFVLIGIAFYFIVLDVSRFF
ncbi:site-2 protease family protein [Thermosipho ferrireducens]|uniref:Site-2 protease family protein n=1 Tax=Thermosipho ferrireducens TaxID=2571116 RepID=A0ABX7S987_9BACT|nr:site-2 protease family protein [Thermosipho ferrireducens]QTA38252.1 site-2 protease family protein [Thermosipho ferrireducens]